MKKYKKDDDNKIAMGVALGLCFGSGIGMVFGLLFDNLPLGLCFGPGIGMSIGITWICLLQDRNSDKETDDDNTNRNLKEEI